MLKQNYKKYAASITIWVVLQSRVPFGVLVIRVPYYIGDLKGALI